ncbi:hypothetical protein A2685_01130 [Candidatus Woesebacteria bacterium RIFCSPHIGHO2_01_FULL_37_10]|uniref:Membrane protein 6-pyruvoyl-tetrahydropterin synthase-related domain-containing protein n=1 Tax=Candidatus Woesebacteria bacterium RIFCSPHIGHO2_01_FULL_37_10 TaxID=1802489 RepID=A0A1F7XXC5_9BACT|nr:MAG: hypothetical protein A2685_01130 [Candidatus Woesebacteria bacterium RIFCSPHIGHO2_01_FULL_37_10]
MKNLIKKISAYKIFWVIVFIVISLPAIYPLIRGDFYHFSDEPHIANLFEMIRAIDSGQFPPRWAPDMSFGFGYPLFNFYYPLPYYIGYLFFKLFGSLILSIKLLFLISVLLSALFMFKWLRLFTGRFESLVGALVYIYTPYRAVDLYVRGALGELFAFIYFPAISYFTYLLLKTGKVKYVGFLALTISFLILSHNLAPIFFIPWIIFFALLLCRFSLSFTNIYKFFASVLLALSASSYFWLPAFIEKSNLVSQTPFNYRDHFPFIKQLIFPSWGYGASHPGIYDDLSFQIGIVNLILISVTTLTLLMSKKNRFLKIFILFSLAGFMFLMNIRSSFVWNILPLADYIQFPWRLLLFTTFLSSSLLMFINAKTKIVKTFLVILGMFSISQSFFYFKPSEYFNPTDDYYLKRFFPNISVSGKSEILSSEYLNYSEDYLLLPMWVDRRANFLPDEKFTSNTVTINEIKELNSVKYLMKISGEEEGSISFNNYYYPGWKIFVDGQEKDIGIDKPYGNISFRILKGEKEVMALWSETNFRKVVDLISLCGILVIIYLITFSKRSGNNNEK